MLPDDPSKDDLDIPKFLRRSKEQQARILEENRKNPIKENPAPFIPPMKSDPEREAFQKAEDERKKTKQKVHFQKLEARKRTPDLKTHNWDTRNARWVPKQFFKMGKYTVTKPNLEEMTGPDLVKAYNELAVIAVGLGIKVETVKRFSDQKTGIKRVDELYKVVCEKSGKEEVDMATTASKKKGAAKKKAAPKKTAAKKAAKSKEPKKKADGIAGECGVRAGSNRELLLKRLAQDKGKQVPVQYLVTAVYGAKEGSVGAVSLVMKGLIVNLKSSKAPYEIRKNKDDKGITYGLFNK